VRANGLDFACFEEGEGPLVLLLHGFPDTAHTWDVVRPRVAAAGHRVVAPFLRGYAPTQIPADGAYDVATLGADVVALLDALSPGEPASVVGHDWGAVAAYAAAALAPARIRRLIAVAIPHPATLRPTPAKLWGVRHFVSLNLPGAERRFARDDFAMADELCRRWSLTWELPADETEPAKNAFAAPGCLRAALGYYRSWTARPPRFLRGRIEVPTLAFGGVDDGVADESDFRHASRAFASRYDVVMTPGGHFLHREAPDAFVEHLLRFLAS